MRPIRTTFLLGIACLMALVPRSASSDDYLAHMRHDFNGNFELFSYPAKPSEELGQFEALAKKQYGALLSEVKSPATMFMCLWRNPSLRSSEDGRPSEIFLSCTFSPTYIEAPQSMLEISEIFSSTDWVNLKANWKLENGNYKLSRFEVEINAKKDSFRSQNLLDDMAQIEVKEDEMSFPKKSGDPLLFTLQSQLPFRRNSGEAQSDPVVSLFFSGVAESTPNWVNY